jgi:ATP-binding cassette, subfamily B, bacterial
VAVDASPADWRWVGRQLQPHRWMATLLVSLSLLEIALRMLLPWPIMAIVDVASGTRPLGATASAVLSPIEAAVAGISGAGPAVRTIVAIVLAGLIVHAAHQLVLFVHSRRQATLGLRMVRALREQLFAHLQAISLVDHERRPTGDAVYRLDADTKCIEQLVLRGVFPFAFSTLTLVTMFVVLLAVEWRLALASMSIVPPLLWWTRRRARRIAPRARAAREAEAAMVAQVYESLSAMRLVKSFVREPHERDRFAHSAGAVMEAHLRAGRSDAAFVFGVGALTAAGTSLVLGLGGLFILDGTSTPGTLLLALTYLGFVYGPLTGVATTASSMQQALVSAARVHETLSIPKEDREHPGAHDPGTIAGTVEYEQVRFAFENGRPVLDEVSFRAEPGQLIAIVGPSGSGKTTLVTLMPRFREPSGGRVLIDGHDVMGYKLAGLRRSIAVVLQEPIILSGTVADNLRYGRLDAGDREVEEAARLANAHDFIVALEHGYDTPLPEAGRRLSGGQKQRLTIARAFLKDAPIVILDEPTAALDPRSENEVVEALRRLRAGRTTFVIAHRLSTVRHADQILVLDHGRIVARGTHDELLERSAFYRDLGRALIQS